MPNTSKGFPYPGGGEKVADTDLQIKALAEFLDANNGRIKWGTDNVQILAADTLTTKVVTFPTPFPSGVVPVVVVSILNATGMESMFLHVGTINRISFEAYGFNNFSTVDIPFTWVAIG